MSGGLFLSTEVRKTHLNKWDGLYLHVILQTESPVSPHYTQRLHFNLLCTFCLLSYSLLILTITILLMFFYTFLYISPIMRKISFTPPPSYSPAQWDEESLSVFPSSCFSAHFQLAQSVKNVKSEKTVCMCVIRVTVALCVMTQWFSTDDSNHLRLDGSSTNVAFLN